MARTRNPASAEALSKALMKILEDKFSQMTPEDMASLNQRREEEEQRRKIKFEKERSAWLEEVSGIPLRVSQLLQSEAFNSKAYACRCALHALKRGKSIILFLGESGTGKTTAAAFALLQRRLDLDALRWAHECGYGPSCPGIFLTAKDVISHRRLNAAPSDLRHNEPLLIIDNFTHEMSKDFQELLDLVITRYDNLLKTIITFNLPAKELQDAFTPQFSSRLREGGIIYELKKKLMPSLMERT
jgi:DNA replication protein DnaC